MTTNEKERFPLSPPIFGADKIWTYSNLNGGQDVEHFNTLEEAYAAAKRDSSIWKITYPDDSGYRIRLIRQPDDSWKNIGILQTS